MTLFTFGGGGGLRPPQWSSADLGLLLLMDKIVREGKRRFIICTHVHVGVHTTLLAAWNGTTLLIFSFKLSDVPIHSMFVFNLLEASQGSEETAGPHVRTWSSPGWPMPISNYYNNSPCEDRGETHKYMPVSGGWWLRMSNF
jgi:hypothetical protein